MRRPRTIVVADRREARAPFWLWLLFAASLMLACAAIRTAGAQTTTPAPLPPKTSETGPTSQPPAAADGPKGVIRPPGIVDRGMTRRPPDAGSFSTPVIPPPGAPGSANPRIVPK